MPAGAHRGSSGNNTYRLSPSLLLFTLQVFHPRLSELLEMPIRILLQVTANDRDIVAFLHALPIGDLQLHLIGGADRISSRQAD